MTWMFPEFAYAMLVVFLFLCLFINLHRKRQATLKLFSSKTPILQRCKKRLFVRSLALCFVWIAAVTALMQPRVKEDYSKQSGQREDHLLEEGKGPEENFERRQQAHDLIVLMDASASMSVADTRTGETRLAYAKTIVDDLVSYLKGQEVALYAFTSEATKLVPLTVDYLYLRLMLRKVDINEGDVAGTDFMEALERMRLEHLDKRQTVAKTLVILSDGGDTKLSTIKKEDRQKDLEAILGRLGNMEGDLVRIFTVGLGTKNGAIIPGLTYQNQPVVSDLDESFLQALSERGHGKYYFANDQSSLAIAENIWGNIKSRTQEKRIKVTEARSKVQRKELGDAPEKLGAHLFQVPLVLAILCLFIDLGMREYQKETLI